MTFEQLWAELVKLQPRLANGSEHIMFTVSSFRQLMLKAYLRGVASHDLKQCGLGEFPDSLREASFRGQDNS